MSARINETPPMDRARPRAARRPKPSSWAKWIFGRKAHYVAAGWLTITASACGAHDGTTHPVPPDPETEPPRSSSSRALPFAGAPQVTNPLPESALSGDPCTALTPQQVKDALGDQVTQERDDIAGIGPTCFWTSARGTGAKIAVTLDTEPRHGLSGLYANVQPVAEVWRVLPGIQGFPAVASVTPAGGALDRYCKVSVGVLDTATVDAGSFLGDSKIGKVDPCTTASSAADAAITTLTRIAGRK
ncbi:DUF3558 domain-containing protein [Amycolatopsis sp. CA-230715]|uniref:DUF3558 domain-containing protein n=1 Tax=Amycolatopsis sp. CA-230715 TaxID=2745196 RepID=UPI001C00E436|nr:DUF3558 domain-containing protein [Amycolatopsis sp. CA-230715]